MSDFAEKTCLPCRGNVASLSRDEAAGFLAHIPGWSLMDGGGRIERTFRFPDFAAALAFVNKVGALAEAENHHPDITFGWGYATVSLHTHAIKGLHENDFIVAAKIGRLTGGAPV